MVHVRTSKLAKRIQRVLEYTYNNTKIYKGCHMITLRFGVLTG